MRRRTTQERILADVTEKDFQAQIVEAAQWLGWLVYHDFDSRRSEPGFPDLVLVGTGANIGRLIVIECKTEHGLVSAAQLKWLGAFMAVPGVEVVTARPSGIDRVLAILKAEVS
jgi:hypothetical protein